MKISMLYVLGCADFNSVMAKSTNTTSFVNRKSFTSPNKLHLQTFRGKSINSTTTQQNLNRISKRLYSRAYKENGKCMPKSNDYDSDPATCDYYEPDAVSIGSAELFKLINELRQTPGQYPQAVGLEPPKQPLSKLKYSSKLEKAAEFQSKDMARCKVCGHRIVEDSNLAARVDSTSFVYSYIAENVLFNCFDKQRMQALVNEDKFNEEKDNFELWRGSPGHLKNMLHPDITHVGVGRVGPYWTIVMGKFGEPTPE